MSQVSIIDIVGTHPEIPTEFVANVGSAIPIANTLEILAAVVLAGSNPIQTVGSGNTITINAQISQAIASTDVTKIGLAAFNSTDFSVDANGFVSLIGAPSSLSFNVDAATAPGTDPVVASGAGIVTITGAQVAAGVVGTNVIRTNSLAANTYTIEIQRSIAAVASTVADNGVAHFNSAQFSVDANGFVSSLAKDLHVAKFIVGDTTNGANFSTFAAATAAASSGDLIAIQSGNYNIGTVTLKSGIKYSAVSDGRFGVAPAVNLIGKLIDNGVAVTNSFTGIQLTTDGDYALALTADSNVEFSNCMLLGIANSILSIASGGSNVYLYNCDTELQTTGTSLYDITNGTLWGYNSNLGNSANSTRAGTLSTGSVRFDRCDVAIPLATTSTGVLKLYFDFIELINQTAITTAGTVTSMIEHCHIASGSASAISIGSGTTVECSQTNIDSSNVNTITGSGTLNYSGLAFIGTSSGINATVQVAQTYIRGADQVTIPTSFPYTVLGTDEVISINTTSTANTVNLPSTPRKGKAYRVKDGSANASTHNITISGNGNNIVGTTIAATLVISSNGGSVDFNYDGTNYIAM